MEGLSVGCLPTRSTCCSVLIMLFLCQAKHTPLSSMFVCMHACESPPSHHWNHQNCCCYYLHRERNALPHLRAKRVARGTESKVCVTICWPTSRPRACMAHRHACHAAFWSGSLCKSYEGAVVPQGANRSSKRGRQARAPVNGACRAATGALHCIAGGSNQSHEMKAQSRNKHESLCEQKQAQVGTPATLKTRCKWDGSACGCRQFSAKAWQRPCATERNEVMECEKEGSRKPTHMAAGSSEAAPPKPFFRKF